MDARVRALLQDVRRDIEDATEEISQAVSEVESGEVPSAEALLSEAHTRLALLVQRLDERLADVD